MTNDKGLTGRLKTLRKHLGLTQSEFARRIYVSLRTVQNWEAGVKSISRRNISLLEFTFGVNPEWLRLGKGSMYLQYIDDSADKPGNSDSEKHISSPEMLLEGKGTYLVSYNGSEMAPVITPECVLVCRNPEPEESLRGKVVIAEVSGKTYCGKYLSRDGQVVLSFNKDIKPIIISKMALDIKSVVIKIWCPVTP